MNDPEPTDLILIHIYFRGVPFADSPWYRVTADTIAQMAADWTHDESIAERGRSALDPRASLSRARAWRVYQVYSDRKPVAHPLMLCFEDVLFIG